MSTPAPDDDLTPEQLRSGMDAAVRVSMDPDMDPEIQDLARHVHHTAYGRLLTSSESEPAGPE